MEYLIFLIPLYMGIMSRLHGSSLPTPKLFEAGLYMAPMIYAMDLIGIYGVLIVLAGVCCIFAKNTGHSDAFQGFEKDNPLSHVLKYLPIDRAGKLYDACFWALKGLLIALVPAILLGSPAIAIASLLGYPVAYYLGFNVLGLRKKSTQPYEAKFFIIPPRVPLPKILHFMPTVWGEFLSGFIAGIGVLIYLL